MYDMALPKRKKVRHKSSKGQIKMTETIGVIFVFLVLVIFGFIFYAKVQGINYRGAVQEENEKRSVEIAQRAATLPELQCSSNNIITDNCFDLLKVELMKDSLAHAQTQVDYYETFQLSRLLIRQLYPGKKEWLLYERNVSNTGSLFTPLPISLYDPIAKRYNFGVLEVTYYPSQ